MARRKNDIVVPGLKFTARYNETGRLEKGNPGRPKKTYPDSSSSVTELKPEEEQRSINVMKADFSSTGEEKNSVIISAVQ